MTSNDHNDKENTIVVENRYQTTTTDVTKMNTNETTTTTNNDNDNDNNEDVFSIELLKMYYSRLFPFDMLYEWLKYDPLNKHPEYFTRREFSFTIDGGINNNEEIYCRHKSFLNSKELKDNILKLKPRKIDIGCINSHNPKDRKAFVNYCPIQRELVFDIDLTDYDTIRLCGCSGAKICTKCWKFMIMAMKLMNDGLQIDFGYKYITWFYSGRRGIHAWICDENARFLSDPARTAIANYFEMPNVTGNNNSNNGGINIPLHPALERAYNILEPMFIEYVLPESGHGLLAKQEHWESLLDTLPKSVYKIRNNLLNQWSNIKQDDTTPKEKWYKLKSHLQYFSSNKNKDGKTSSSTTTKRQKNNMLTKDELNDIERWPIQIVFKYTYPRLDINVSKRKDHLLKSPFCVHPKTGRVCVPIQVDTVDTFDPFTVPTLPRLMKELDQYEKDNNTIKNNNNNNDDKMDVDGDDDDDQEKQKQQKETTATTTTTKKNLKEWEKTSLKEYFEPFQKDFLEPLVKELRRKERDMKEQNAARIGDF